MTEMQIHLQEPMRIKLKTVSQTTGIEEEQLIQRAVRYYLEVIQKQVEFSAEINAWERLSDEALVNFEDAL